MTSAFQPDEWTSHRWENGDRYYSLGITQDLFGGWAVCAGWGSLYSKHGRFITKAVCSRDEAIALYHKVARRREKRGYSLIEKRN